MLNEPDAKLDVESGAMPLLPVILESPELIWSFIKKVYSIVALQFLATIAFGANIFIVGHNPNFFPTTTTDFALFIGFIFAPFSFLYYVYYYGQKYHVNYIVLGIFTHSTSNVFRVVSCALTSEKVNLEAVILTAVVVIALTLYTFWAARRGQDFSFLDLFLFGSLLVLLVVGLIQIIFFQVGKLSVMIYGCVATIIFCGYIVYDTDNLIKKRFSYDEYIWASVTLYLDIIFLFLSLLTVFSAAD